MRVNGDEVYTAADAAAKLGVTPDTLKRQRQNGRISGIRIGRDYVYSAGEIRRYQIEIQQRAGKRSAVGRRKSTTTTTTTEYDHPEKLDASS